MSRESTHDIVANYDYNVFINCPFDAEYTRIFEAIIFTVEFLGFTSRSALEQQNANEARITKITRIIAECKYGIHDLSRVELSASGLPRFNMPFELGLDIGCCAYGGGRFADKSSLILDRDRFRYQRFISDISGQDISSYDGSVRGIIRVVRDWLHQHTNHVPAGAATVHDSFKKFRRAESKLRAQLRLDAEGELSFLDYSAVVRTWLEAYR